MIVQQIIDQSGTIGGSFRVLTAPARWARLLCVSASDQASSLNGTVMFKPLPLFCRNCLTAESNSPISASSAV